MMNIFDPQRYQSAANPMPTTAQTARDRLMQLEQEHQMYPGSAPGGTGATGLNPRDAQGYSQMLNRRSEYLALKNIMAGQAPPNERYGGDLGGTSRPDGPTASDDADALFAGKAYGVGGQEQQANRRAMGDAKYGAAMKGLRDERSWRLG